MKTLQPEEVLLEQPWYVVDIRPLTDDVFDIDTLDIDTHTTLDAIQTGSFPDVPCDTPMLIICQYGRVSELAAAYLEAAGFSEVYNLAGGIQAYRRWVDSEAG